MVDKKQEPTQPTRPKTGKPAEIPIPTRDAVLRDLTEAAKPDKDPDFGVRRTDKPPSQK